MSKTMQDKAALAAKLRHIAATDTVSPTALAALVADVFIHCGVPRQDAETGAEVALWAQTHGSDSHGVVHLPLYTRGLLDGTIKSNPSIATTQALPCSIVMDADHALGLVASRRAMDLAIGLAKTYGVGAVAVRNSSHFGAAGYYVDHAAAQGLIGLAFTNASPAIAPTGGTEGLFGTNPIGVGFPLHDAEPIVADMATAAVARSRIRHMLASGQKSIPAGWALDPSGQPTTDPAEAVKGSVLPIGGPKGYALSLMVEVLCSALSDGEPGFQVTYENVVKRSSNICHFFLVLNPQGFAGTQAYETRMAHIAEAVGKAKPMQGAEPPRLPGARGHAVKRKIAADGIAMFDNLRAALKNVAGMIEAP
ncbi:MAG: Ldh family oxidoreductase [Xanthobacteraceae bacterium]